MHSFRDRPLTWLFLIATGCIDILAIAGDVNRTSGWFSALAIGQMWVAGGWLAIGVPHRLLRATVFLLTPIVLTIPDYLHSLYGGSFTPVTPVVVWREILGASLFVTDLAAAMTMLLIGLSSALIPRSQRESFAKLQFPLVELFGWTIIVALVCLAFRAARFEFLNQRTLQDSLMLTALPASMMAFFGGTHRKTKFLVIATVVSLVASVIPGVALGRSADWQTVGGAYLYVAVWLLVQRMDEARLKRIKGRTLSSAAESTPKPSTLAEQE